MTAMCNCSPSLIWLGRNEVRSILSLSRRWSYLAAFKPISSQQARWGVLYSSSAGIEISTRGHREC